MTVVREYSLDESVPPADGGLDEPRPAVSVVIPVYDDPQGIRRTVESLSDAPYDPLEIVVVRTPADGATADALESLAASEPRLRTFVEDDHCTPGAARNVGVRRADGDVVAFVDADTAVAPDFPARLAAVFARTDVDYLGYPVELTHPDGELSRAGRYDRRVRFPVRFFMEVLEFSPTCAVSVRASVFEDGHAFDESLLASEDVVFGKEVAAGDYEVGFCPDLSVRHPVRNSVRAVLRKGVKTGRGMYQVDRQYPESHGDGSASLLSPKAYTPFPVASVASTCRGWDALDRRHRAAVYAASYVEKLSRTVGYALETLCDRYGVSRCCDGA